MAHSTTQMRRLLFTPASSKEQLSQWIQNFLGVHLPDCVVCEESNSSPMDALWMVYEKAVSNNIEEAARVMMLAPRGGYKTLSTAILEVALLFHTPRNIVHFAAVQGQSEKVQRYLSDFFSRPHLRDFRTRQSSRVIDMCCFFDQQAQLYLTQEEWNVLSDSEKSQFKCKDNYVRIALLSLNGAACNHAEVLVVDELDSLPMRNFGAYDEAQYIPEPYNELKPITLLVSTRKFGYGLVQKEIADTSRSGLETLHYNAVDITQACGPERHKPELPRVFLFVNDAQLTTKSESEYIQLEPKEQIRYVRYEGFGGCTSCSLFSVCKSRLATHQISKSSSLKSIDLLQEQLKNVSVQAASTQIMCRQPTSAI